MSLSITILFDNKVFDKKLRPGWGFGCLVKTADKNILFDTGADAHTLILNMTELGISPKQIDMVIISHPHGNHAGGLFGILGMKRDIPVCLPELIPESFIKIAQKYGAKIVEIDRSPFEVCKNVYLLRISDGETKEQFLAMRTKEGLVIITGCAHPDILNIIRKSKNALKENLYMVLGGFHLLDKKDKELREILKDFRKSGVVKVAPCHCTGEKPMRLLKDEYKENYVEIGAGRIIEIKG